MRSKEHIASDKLLLIISSVVQNSQTKIYLYQQIRGEDESGVID
jgi:hypothetical protein